MKTLARIIASVAVALSMTATAHADVDFSGKTIEWTIPFSETGGSAKWANFFAPLLSENLPGKPTVVVKFMQFGMVDCTQEGYSPRDLNTYGCRNTKCNTSGGLHLFDAKSVNNFNQEQAQPLCLKCRAKTPKTK